MANKTCFVIAPIGADGSEIRKRSDRILEYVIKPAVEACGYEPVRADQISEPGLITNQVIQHIMDDPLVVADLTGPNANVFYELAIRHMIRKPLVQIIQAGEKIPFDLANTRTIPLDYPDPKSIDETKQEIVRQVESLHKNPDDVETPISVSIDQKSFKQSENPTQRVLASLVDGIAEMRQSLANLESRSKFAGKSERARRGYAVRKDAFRRKLEDDGRSVDPDVLNETFERLEMGAVSWSRVESLIDERFPIVDENAGDDEPRSNQPT